MSRGRSHSIRQRCCLSLLGLAVLAWFGVMPGCTRSPLPPGPKGTVAGKATYNGSPVPAGSIVMFVHEQTSLAATGQVSADGSFAMTMLGSAQIPTGKYTVSVNPPVSAPVTEETDMEAYKAIMEGTQPAPVPQEPFPAKYKMAETSGLTFDVAEGANDFVLEMTEDEEQP